MKITTTKQIGYAAPHTTLAIRAGCVETGCWYLSVGDATDRPSAENIVHTSIHKEDVIIYAEIFNCPWGVGSMHEEGQ